MRSGNTSPQALVTWQRLQLVACPASDKLHRSAAPAPAGRRHSAPGTSRQLASPAPLRFADRVGGSHRRWPATSAARSTSRQLSTPVAADSCRHAARGGIYLGHKVLSDARGKCLATPAPLRQMHRVRCPVLRMGAEVRLSAKASTNAREALRRAEPAHADSRGAPAGCTSIGRPPVHAHQSPPTASTYAAAHEDPRGCACTATHGGNKLAPPDEKFPPYSIPTMRLTPRATHAHPTRVRRAAPHTGTPRQRRHPPGDAASVAKRSRRREPDYTSAGLAWPSSTPRLQPHLHAQRDHGGLPAKASAERSGAGVASRTTRASMSLRRLVPDGVDPRH